MRKNLATASGLITMAVLVSACGGGRTDEMDAREDALAKPGTGASTYAIPAADTVSGPAGVVVTELKVVSTTKLPKNVVEYTFSVAVKAGVAATTQLAVSLAQVGADTAVVDGTSVFSALAAGGTATSPDTITVRQSNAKAFDPTTWKWNIAGSNVLTGTWTGTWRWTSCPAAFACSLTTDYDNVLENLTQDGTSVSGTIFTGISNVVDQGTFDGTTFQYNVVYPNRTDVHDTCVVTLTATELSGACQALYDTGAGSYVISAHIP